MTDAIRGARSAYERRAWDDSFAAYSRASEEGALEPADLQRMAWAALLSGRDEASLDALERLHQLLLEAGETLPAARAAFWLGLRLMSLGERARGGGWLGKAQRLVDEDGRDCVERGYLRLAQVFRCTAGGDFAGAREAAAKAAADGDRHGDGDLSALGRNLEGRSLVRLGRVAEGLPLLDEAMLKVTSGGLSPVVSGLIYCSVIAGCQQSYALDRAREWTAALSGWCEAQPQLVAFAGACLVHRSEILQLGGAWSEALEEARRASIRLVSNGDGEAGNAAYQEGELRRLAGEHAEAEQAYVLASERGRDPQPGLALLRLAQGRVDLAAAATRRVLSSTRDPLSRARILPAHVEIMLAASDPDEARRAADELGALAEPLGMEALSATARQADGAVTLAEGDAAGAIEPLRRALEVWTRLGAPYPGARIRVLMAQAYRALGDEDGARLELDAARKLFVRLGASPDVAAVDALAVGVPSAPGEPRSTRGSHGLSPRELEVLLLVASGETNKAIAARLFVSERTVHRHVSNIFGKLEVTSRAAATAWAYENGLAG